MNAGGLESFDARDEQPVCDPVHDLERSVVSALLVDGSEIESVAAILSEHDFSDVTLRPVYRSILALHRCGHDVDVVTLVDELECQGDLDVAGGIARVAHVSDFECTAVNIVGHAQRVRMHALERTCRRLHLLASTGDPSTDLLEEIAAAHADLGRAKNGGMDFARIGFSGERLRALRRLPTPKSPLPDYLDSEPHLHLIQGKQKSAKTTFAAKVARDWALGESPWTGAPELPGSRALIVTREQSVTRVDSTLRRLSMFSQTDGRERWTDRLTLVGRHDQLSPEERRLLTLDDEGVAMLRALLLQATDVGDPFGLVVLDSLSRLKPPTLDENDNSMMAIWLDSLEDVASECASYVMLIHHVGHSSDPGRTEARSAGRGASAIGAGAQVTWLLERVPGEPRHRLLKVDGNAILPAEHTFEICGPNAEPGSVHYFKPVDPLSGHDLDELVGAGEKITSTALAWRLAGKVPKTKTSRPPGRAIQLATALRNRWEEAGRVTIEAGPHGSKLIRKVDDDAA